MLEPQDQTPWYMWILIIVIILALAFFLPLFGLLGFGILINLVEGLLRFHLWLRLEVFLDDARQMLRHLVILNKSCLTKQQQNK